MSITNISPTAYKFLKELNKNNNREWFELHKKEFKIEESLFKKFFNELYNEMTTYDEIDKIKIFRIYRDVRFSKNKTPYKTHFSGSFHRVKPRLRGGYYLHIEPNNTFIACGFWDPEASDLLRIRKEFEMDDTEIRKLISDKNFIKIFEKLEGDTLKTAPKGFDKEHSAIDLIRMKQYIAIRRFTDKEAMEPDFMKKINESYKAARPWFNYMSDVLTTDLNGVSLID
jgi:uncharacterized protein (TIGR02453 family)